MSHTQNSAQPSALNPPMAEENHSNNHIVPMPKWSSALGCAKFGIALIVLSFVVACIAIWGGFSAFILTIHTSAYTLLIFVYYIISLSYRPQIYNRYAIVALEAIGVILWLISMILLAQWASAANTVLYWEDNIQNYFNTPSTSTSSNNSYGFEYSPPRKYKATTILAGISAALAGVQFILFLTTLIVFSLSLHRQRAAGYPSMYGDPMRPVNQTSNGPVEQTRSHEKDESKATTIQGGKEPINTSSEINQHSTDDIV